MNIATALARKPIRRRLAAVGMISAAILALSACAPSTSNGGPTHVVHTTSTSKKPKPKPTPVTVAPPQVRIPLSCDQLASVSQMNTVLSATLSPKTPSTGNTQQTTIDPDLTADIVLQDGALDCSWTSPVDASGNSDATVDMTVTPDATAAWNSQISKIHQFYSVKDPAGPNTWSACWVETLATAGKDENCGFDALVGSVWLSMGAYTDKYGAIPSEAQVLTRLKPLFLAAIAKVKTITATEPAWSDPAAKTVTFPSSGGAVSFSGLSAAIGLPVTYVGDGSGPISGTTIGTYFDAEALAVNYHGDNAGSEGAKAYNLADQVLPSGAWAFAALEAASTGKPLFAKLTGIGSDAFMFGQSYPDPNAIVIIGTSGDNLYTVEVSTDGAAGRPDPLTVAKAAAAYFASQLDG